MYKHVYVSVCVRMVDEYVNACMCILTSTQTPPHTFTQAPTHTRTLTHTIANVFYLNAFLLIHISFPRLQALPSNPRCTCWAVVIYTVYNTRLNEICTFTRMYVYYIFACMYWCIRAYARVYARTCICICICTHIHTHIYGVRISVCWSRLYVCFCMSICISI